MGVEGFPGFRQGFARRQRLFASPHGQAVNGEVDPVFRFLKTGPEKPQGVLSAHGNPALPERLQDGLKAPLGGGVVHVDAVVADGLSQVLVHELLDQSHHPRGGVVARCDEGFQPQAVRLRFQLYGVGVRDGELCNLRQDDGGSGPAAQEHHGQRGDRNLVGLSRHAQAVFAVRVAHLVGHHRRDLGVRVQEVQEPRGEEDETAGQAEGVECLRLHQADLVGDAALHVGFQSVQDHGEPCDGGGVGFQRPLPLDLLKGPAPDGSLLLQVGVVEDVFGRGLLRLKDCSAVAFALGLGLCGGEGRSGRKGFQGEGEQEEATEAALQDP